MGSNRGTTLLETLVAVALSGILFASFYTVFGQTQTVVSNLNLLLEPGSESQPAPPTAQSMDSLRREQPQELQTCGLVYRIRTPLSQQRYQRPVRLSDGKLRAPFEGLVLKCEKGHLKLKSGRGGFQPILKNIREWELTSRNRKIEVKYRLNSTTPT